MMHTLVGGLLSIFWEMKMLQSHWRGKAELGMPSQNIVCVIDFPLKFDMITF